MHSTIYNNHKKFLFDFGQRSQINITYSAAPDYDVQILKS